MDMLIGFFFGCFITSALGVFAVVVALKNSIDNFN
jgi:hypothetical protein